MSNYTTFEVQVLKIIHIVCFFGVFFYPSMFFRHWYCAWY